MHAEIIAVGSELTTGAKLDTNSQWLSLELAATGIPVRFHSTVADDLEPMLAVLRAAVHRSDLVLLTGGLGPTRDDLTRQAFSELAQAQLVLHQPSLERIREMFARRRIEMPERNAVQALFPEGSVPLDNPVGTAPGIWLEVPRKGAGIPCLVAALPGVPSEMRRMFVEQVLPRLPGTGRVIRRHRVNCFGLGESAAEELLGDMTARGRDPEVGITAHEGTITLRITAHGDTPDSCAQKIAATVAEIRQRLGGAVFGEEDEELEHVVVRLLSARGRTLATAESGTGGLLAQRLTETAGFDGCYLGGVVAAGAAVKRDLLDLDGQILERAGRISGEAAAGLAAGCRRRFGSDFALAVTEYPSEEAVGPGMAPAAFVALAGEGLLEVEEHVLTGDRTIARSRAAKAAMDLLRRRLTGGEAPSTDD